jgi:hypothetical protein
MKNKRKRWLLLALLLLLLSGALGWYARRDDRLDRARALQKELTNQASRNLPPEQRRQKWRDYRAARGQLSAAQRQELMAEARKRRQAQMARYFRMSQQDRTRYLDDQIQRMEKARQAWQARGGSGGAGTGTGTTGQGTGETSQRTAASRDERRQERLDSTTPAERAQFVQFMKDLNTRRAQLGLPAGGFGGRR